MSWSFLYFSGPGFFGVVALVFLLAMLAGLPMFLLQLFSGEKWKFFNREPDEAIYNKNR
ncbi:MAG: hypothetical protein IJS96_07040 [Schwartzia sp.]|nr:hypothetical protein [Schwartzia sp. (in: firmicutes)]